MAQYEIVKSPGFQFPVGHVFETDALHPSMVQFVKLMRGKKTAVAKVENENEGPDYEDLIGADYEHDVDIAFDLAASEYASREKPAETKTVKTPAKPKPAVKPNDGPGENS